MVTLHEKDTMLLPSPFVFVLLRLAFFFGPFLFLCGLFTLLIRVFTVVVLVVMFVVRWRTRLEHELDARNRNSHSTEKPA
jgi:membrane protein implicated in regulation of membrane protease activity